MRLTCSVPKCNSRQTALNLNGLTAPQCPMSSQRRGEMVFRLIAPTKELGVQYNKAAMSVGISVSDVLAASSLAKDICSCLKEIGGAKAEYQDLERELECLQKALTHLDRLQSKKPSPTIDSIRFAALSCRRPLEEFLGKIRRYETSLGPECTKKSLQGQLDKIRFRFGQSDEIRKLQNYLSVHLGTINILLAEHGLETLMLASEDADSERLQIHQRLDDTQNLLRRVQDNISAQTATVLNGMSILAKVHSIVSGETQSPWASMKEIVVKAW